ncbi:MAG: hypothetical protein ACFB22_04880 [Rhodothalassiaceae bacterium]
MPRISWPAAALNTSRTAAPIPALAEDAAQTLATFLAEPAKAASLGLSGADVDRLADALSASWSTQTGRSVSAAEYVALLQRVHLHNALALQDTSAPLPASLVYPVLERVQDTLTARPGWLAAPALRGYLQPSRTRALRLDPEPAVLVDPLDELAYLTLELDMLGRRWIGDRLREHYEADIDRPRCERLWAFYSTLRAAMAARLLINDPDPSICANTRRSGANAYLAIAERHSARFCPRTR